MALRAWMTENDVTRPEVASALGITTGHLSTLINANRTPSQRQVDIANEMMGERPAPRPVTPPVTLPVSKRPTKKKPVQAKPLRPLTKEEGEFVALIAKAWIKDNAGASRAEFVDIVRALSISIRG